MLAHPCLLEISGGLFYEYPATGFHRRAIFRLGSSHRSASVRLHRSYQPGVEHYGIDDRADGSSYIANCRLRIRHAPGRAGFGGKREGTRRNADKRPVVKSIPLGTRKQTLVQLHKLVMKVVRLH